MRFEPLVPSWLLLACIAILILWASWLAVRAFRLKRRDRVGFTSIWTACAALLLIGIGSGPSVPGNQSPAGMVNLDIVFVVDRTASSGALDFNGNQERLVGMRNDIGQLVDKFNGARMSLVVFGHESQVIVPLSTDSSTLKQQLPLIEQEIATYGTGTSIDTPIPSIESLLKRSQTEYPTRGRLLFYLGDGEQTVDKAPQSFAKLNSYINGGGVLGYGTVTGGKMKQYSGLSHYGDQYVAINGNEYVMDETGSAPAVSRFDESALRTIAQQLNVPFIHRTDTSGLGSFIVDTGAQQVADTHREVLHYQNLYWVVSIGMVLLLAIWLVVSGESILRGVRGEE